ncbi:MAG: hypothetical protein ACK4UN_13045 [Limisphaerales bacterium]
MAKKKASRKKPSGSPAKRKSAAKKTVTPTAKEPRGPDHGGLALWQQIPGTFTYTSLEPVYEWKLICKAKRPMTQYELDESWTAHKIFNPFTARNGETLEFDAIENATQAMRRMIWKPTPEFTAKLKAFFDKLVPDSSCRNASLPHPFACPQCHGVGWVCEDHIFVPWEVKCGRECPCGAPEMACRTCNPKSAILVGPGDFIFGSMGCFKCADQRWLCVKHNKPWQLPYAGCDCGPGNPCPDCNPEGHLKLGELKVIRTGLN